MLYGVTFDTTKNLDAAIIAAFAGLRIDHPRFVGGYLWWSFVKEMVNGPFLPDLLAGYGRA